MSAVHIDDLATPRFPPDAEAIIASAADFADQVHLTSDALCAQAMSETGIDRFADSSFVARLELLLDALSGDARLSPMGRVTTSVQLTQLLKNRLLLDDLLRRHPEIHDVEILRPIIVAGLPRTGTTHLHNLLSADPALRSLPYWESLEPILSVAEADAVAAGAPDPRIGRAEAGTTFLDLALPYFKRMHEMTPEHVHEEIQLMAMDFSTMLFETTAPMPTWRDYYLSHDQTPHYEYLRTVLKALQFLRGGERWVLKSPQHLEQFDALIRVFPDATVLVTHRDPVSVTASMSTMIAYTSRLHLDPVDPAAIGHYWADRLEVMLRSCVDRRHVLPAEQSLDVLFEQFMSDDMGTIEQIYVLADQPLDDWARHAIGEYRATHQRNRHGGLVYDLADFDLDAGDVRAANHGYTQRFGVVHEH